MGIISQNTYLERDRYYHAVVAIPEGTSAGKLTKIFKDNHVWWWEVASGPLDQWPGFEWHYAFLKAVGMNIRPVGIASVLAPAAVLISDEPVGKATTALLEAGEFFAGDVAGYDPSEGAMMAAQDVLQPEAYYATYVEWDTPAAVLKQEEIVYRLKTLGIAVFDIDGCLPTLPMPFLESAGNLSADTVNYDAKWPTFAWFLMSASNTNQNAKKIRDTLSARNIYILRKPFAGTVDGAMLSKMCFALVSLKNIVFSASRYVAKATEVLGEITSPSYIPAILGIGAGAGIVWLGMKVLGWRLSGKK